VGGGGGGGGAVHLHAIKRPALLRTSEDGGKITASVLTAFKLLMGTVTRRNWSAIDAMLWPLSETSAAIFTPSNTSITFSPLADVFHSKVRDRVQAQESQAVDLKFKSKRGSPGRKD